MGSIFGGIGLLFVIFAIIGIVPFVAVAIIMVQLIKNASKFQSAVFHSIDKDLYQKIDKAEKPNKHYVKTKCDNCGAKCTNACDISPRGDLKCEYCQTWFNVLRM